MQKYKIDTSKFNLNYFLTMLQILIFGFFQFLLILKYSHGFPSIKKKTAEYRATRHEIKNLLYEAIDLFKPRRLTYTRESETPK